MQARTVSWLVFSFAAALPAQIMVADVNAQPPYVDAIGSNPRAFRTFAGLCYFTAGDGARGNQLWVSDGTTAGTRVVRMMPRNDLFQPQGFVELGGIVYFTGYSVSEQYALWRTDGTAAGTYVLRHFFTPSLGFALRNLTVANGFLWFSASDGQHGEELWRSDGTIAGTAMVIDLDGSPSSSLPGQCVAANGAVLFTAAIGSNRELWRSDGTAGGTWQVADLVPGAGGSFPQFLTSLPGGAVFTASTAAFGNELWWTDGTTAGTQLLMDVVPGPNSASLQGFVAVGSRVYFTAQTASGTELWSTDGTTAGTGIVSDIATGSASSSPQQLTPFGNLLLFSADDGVHGREPWRSDGTPAGTWMLADLAAGGASSVPLHFASTGTAFYCDAALGTGRTLCIGNGANIAGIRTFASIDAIGAFGTSALCCADDGVNGPEPWITDGTPVGTSLLLDIQYIARGSSPAGLRAIGDDLVYSADDGVSGREPWRVPAGGTPTLLGDLMPGPQSSLPGFFVEFQGLLWFRATDPAHGVELWRTDGTANGTQLFVDLTPGPASTNMTSLTAAAGRLFFVVGSTLWACDGTVAGTTPLRTFFLRQPFPFLPSSLTAFAGKLVFAADDASTGVELWQSDGTAAGTTLLRDIQPGGGFSTPDHFAVAGGQLFFRANDGQHGTELWVSDGTAAGTTGIDVQPGGASSYPDQITPDGTRVFLTMIDNASVPRLWRSDGTVAGTVPLGAAAGDPRSLAVAGGKLFFSATDGAGREPWVSDGTPVGTFRLRDVNPGSNNSMLTTGEFGAAGSGVRVLFGADDGVHGVELWTSDGTTNGTTLLADLAPDLIGSNPSAFTRVGTDLYFVADDYAHGAELWRLPLAQLQVPLVDTIAAGCAPVGGAAPRLAAVGLPVLGNPSFDLRVEGAPPTTFVLTAFDVALLPIPFAGCTGALANPFVILLGISDGAGVQTTSFAIPAANPLLGLILLEQDIVFDANGPAGLITLSNALRTMIGQ